VSYVAAEVGPVFSAIIKFCEANVAALAVDGAALTIVGTTGGRLFVHSTRRHVVRSGRAPAQPACPVPTEFHPRFGPRRCASGTTCSGHGVDDGPASVRRRRNTGCPRVPGAG